MIPISVFTLILQSFELQDSSTYSLQRVLKGSSKISQPKRESSRTFTCYYSLISKIQPNILFFLKENFVKFHFVGGLYGLLWVFTIMISYK